jgi:hypothetical protein
MSAVSSVEETILPATRAAPSHHFVQKSTLPLPISNKLYILNQELHMHKSPNTIFLSPPHIDHEPHISTSLPHHYHHQPSLHQSNDIQELTTIMKGLFDQQGSMLNLLTTVLAKLT